MHVCQFTVLTSSTWKRSLVKVSLRGGVLVHRTDTFPARVLLLLSHFYSENIIISCFFETTLSAFQRSLPMCCEWMDSNGNVERIVWKGIHFSRMSCQFEFRLLKANIRTGKCQHQNGPKRRKGIWNVFLWLSNYMQISSIDSTFLFDQRFFTMFWTFLAVTCHDRGSVSYLVHKILLVRFQFFFVFHSWIYTERSKNVTVLLKFTTSSKPYRSTKYLQWLFRPNALLRSWNSATWSNFSTPFISG